MNKHPSLPTTFFIENRNQLLNNLEKDSIALLQSSEWMVRNSDIRHFWRQDSNFFYLTGIEQPECTLLLIPQNHTKPKVILFIPPYDAELEKWEGKLLNQEEAKQISGIEHVYTQDQFLTVFYRTQKYKNTLYCEVNDIFPDQPLTKHHLFLQEISTRLPGLRYQKIAPLLAKLRSIKRTPEIQYLKKSIGIIHQGLKSVMKKVQPGMMEYQLEAELAYHYLNNGCTRLGYDSIVATGKNATILHYTNNSAQISEDDLILIDTGGEYGMYSGDITRVIPANGRFKGRGKLCYETVLEIQTSFLKELKAGYSWDELYKLAAEIQGEILYKQGFIKNPQDYLSVSFHRIGHSLGLDIHDVGETHWKLPENSIITVEPGLYLPDEGIGIRIEDNIQITKTGIINLSENIPKQIEEIETICNQ